jgi:osmotically-inducible protein OsmY
MSEPPPRAGRLLVTVGDGVVTLSGEVDDQIERDRLLDLVRDVGSVREVRDRLHVRKATRDSD